MTKREIQIPTFFNRIFHSLVFKKVIELPDEKGFLEIKISCRVTVCNQNHVFLTKDKLRSVHSTFGK